MGEAALLRGHRKSMHHPSSTTKIASGRCEICPEHIQSPASHALKREQLVLPTAVTTHNASELGPSAETTMSCRGRDKTTRDHPSYIPRAHRSAAVRCGGQTIFQG
eukprot:m.192705 g.192705  ORF g.192705 m.192705 type:complete len:106 (-) comp15172_c0_seq1:137-454(-)